jgi:hypothetical protein
MDEALRVMKVLFKSDCEPGSDFANAMAPTWFAQAGLDASAYHLGLEQAANNGWLIRGGRPDTTQMTAAGLAAATKDAN